MFTGIIEAIGTIQSIESEQNNLHFHISSPISDALKIDQSVSHDGVCLTVVAIKNNVHVVTAVQETLQKSHLAHKKVGDAVNLERALIAGARLDGHFVQGHVDQITECLHVQEEGGSWRFQFALPAEQAAWVIPKGSIAINGVSLTVANLFPDRFEVAIIPYTYQHTQFHQLQAGDPVNLEFDMLGKYITRWLSLKEVSS